MSRGRIHACLRDPPMALFEGRLESLDFTSGLSYQRASYTEKQASSQQRKYEDAPDDKSVATAFTSPIPFVRTDSSFEPQNGQGL